MKIKLSLAQTGIVLICACLLVLLLISCQDLRTLQGRPQSSAATDVSPTPGSGQSTPQDAVLNYYHAVNERNVELMATLFDPEDESNQRFLDGFRNLLESGTIFELSSPKIYIIEEDAQWTRIRTNHYQKMFQDGRLVAEAESGGEYTLIRKGDKWYFIGMGDPIRPGWLIDQP